MSKITPPMLFGLLGAPEAMPLQQPIPRPTDDHYRSPPACGRALATVVDLTDGVHEFCAGDGILAAGLDDVLGDGAVYASTIHQPVQTYFPVTGGVDFLTLSQPARRHLVTNPPYSFLHGRRLGRAGAATRLISHALRLLVNADDGGMLCCLLDLRYRLSVDRNKSGELLYEYPPARIHAFADRVTMYPSSAGDAMVDPGVQSFAWFIWEPPYHRPGAGSVLRVDLIAKRFERPDDRVRFHLPLVRSGKAKRSPTNEEPQDNS